MLKIGSKGKVCTSQLSAISCEIVRLGLCGFKVNALNGINIIEDRFLLDPQDGKYYSDNGDYYFILD
jgi:hypothetical protein